MSVYLSQEGDDDYYGSAHAYDQVDYPGYVSDYKIYRNSNGSVTVSHPNYGTDILWDIDGFWFWGEEAWYSIDDAISLTEDGSADQGQNSDAFYVNDYDVLIGTDQDDTMYDTDGHNSLFGGAGNDIFIGREQEYSQVDYDGSVLDYNFQFEDDGTLIIESDETGRDMLTNIDGFWFNGEGRWLSIEDIARLVSDDNSDTDNSDNDGSDTDNSDNDGSDNDGSDDDDSDSVINTGVLINGVVTGSNDLNDTLIGTNGNDVFFAGRGTDFIDGGEGSDTLRVDGDIIEWTFAFQEDGSLVMSHPTWGANTLSGIEQIVSLRAGESYTIAEAIALTDQLPAFRVDNDDVLNGTLGNDFMRGDASGTSFYGGLGNDAFIGSESAFDQVNFDGLRSEYTFTQNSNGSITVDHPIWGTDTLMNIDGIVFTGREPGADGAELGAFEFVDIGALFG